MWLAVDSGNTRVKWALMEGERIVAQGAAPKARPALPLAPDLSAVWVAHVGGAGDLQRLKKLLRRQKKVRFLCSGSTIGGARNPYQPPAALGVDRWLCLLAARRLQAQRRRGAVVVSAGTAITIDILSAAGAFMGGLIAPGLDIMPAALYRATPLTRAAGGKVPAGRQPPRCTADAIETGARLAAAGAIQAARRRYAPGARLLITGGDAARLQPHLPAARLVPDLLFRGMAALYRREVRRA